jgi:hypothetical protein
MAQHRAIHGTPQSDTCHTTERYMAHRGVVRAAAAFGAQKLERYSTRTHSREQASMTSKRHSERSRGARGRRTNYSGLSRNLKLDIALVATVRFPSHVPSRCSRCQPIRTLHASPSVKYSIRSCRVTCGESSEYMSERGPTRLHTNEHVSTPR